MQALNKLHDIQTDRQAHTWTNRAHTGEKKLEHKYDYNYIKYNLLAAIPLTI